MTIRELIEGIGAGQVRIPAFQRDFVWEPDRIALFVDSIYKGYPFGSLLFWRAKELLKHERKLGPYELPPLREDYPIDYVLDGQQRVTAMFASFQTELARPAADKWTDIYFDYQAEADPQDSSFFALTEDEADPDRFFPVSVLFDITGYRQATERVEPAHLPHIDDLQSKIKEAQIPVEVLRTDDRAKVAIVFERINHQGVPLDTLQLLTAWTWSEDFDLQQRFEDLREALEEHGFAGVGEDTSLVLRCCAAILTGQPTADYLIPLNGSEVRDRFDEVENGIKGAIDFLRTQLGVETLRNMPYPAMLIPLSVYFAIPGTEQLTVPAQARRTLERWFWRSCFSERYSGQTNRVARSDVREMVLLREEEESRLGEFAVPAVLRDFFSDTVFRLGSARSATFVLLLASREPRSFISGNKVDLAAVLQAYNRHEFHHMYPRALLRDDGVPSLAINCLANMCILNRADNNKIKRQRPSEYKALMPTDGLDAILSSAVTTETLFTDDFESFREERAEMLAEIAETLIA
jgi:hypothetical protein